MCITLPVRMRSYVKLLSTSLHYSIMLAVFDNGCKGRPSEGEQCVGAVCTTQPGTTDTNCCQRMTVGVYIYIFYVAMATSKR